jgi:hypothetical protein
MCCFPCTRAHTLLTKKKKSTCYKRFVVVTRGFVTNATGMTFSSHKSQFLEVGWSREELSHLKEILPYEVKYLDESFNYLGFFLKPNCHSVNDWRWMLIKVEKIISNWCHIWLTLGGKFILIKSVLESILVYWLSMAKIPKSILDIIRRRMFSFLWTSKKEKASIHLVNWNRIAKPKKNGGWGFKNILCFGKSLATNNFWRSLLVPCLWHEVIHKKCLKNKSVFEWFREGRMKLKGVSNC